MAEMSAFDNSRMWLETAKAANAKGLHPTALYSAQMAVEIALKGILILLHADAPKSHNIAAFTKSAIDKNRKLLPHEFLEKEQFIIETFTVLMDLRPVAGYSYERNIDMKDMARKADEYVAKAEEVIRLCERAAHRLGRNG